MRAADRRPRARPSAAATALGAVLAAAALLLGPSGPAAAQAGGGQGGGDGGATALVGTVISAEKGEPIEGVEVELVGIGRTATTDEQGEFVFQGVSPGPVRIRFRRQGVASRTMQASLQEGVTTDLTARIPAEPVEVDELRVDVSGQVRSGVVAAAQRRAYRSAGVFLGPEDLASTGGSGLANLLKQQSRVKTQRCRAGSSAGRRGNDRGSGSSLGVGPEDQQHEPGAGPPDNPDNPRMGRGYEGEEGPAGGFEGRYIPGCQRVVVGRDCEPRFYLDGSPLPKDDPAIARNLGNMNASTLAAVELYRSPSEIPAQFRTADACAVVLLWSRRGATQR